MKGIKSETGEFLRDILMHPDLTDIQMLTEQFMSEMERGLRGEASSLKMIPTYISADGTPPDDVPVIAIDAGGTNLRIALVVFSNGVPVISRVEKYEMPGSRTEVSSDEFFDGLAEKILPFTEKSEIIGFCFSYPAEIFPNRDGKILCLTKEVCVTNAEGLVIGYELLKKLHDKGAEKNFKFTLLNDTAASLMGGVAVKKHDGCDGLAGLILGTGNNTCYVEKGEKILKLNGAQDMIINCESGNFSKALRGVSDEMTDESSENPGEYLFEKMLSGVYHGKVITNTAVLASRKGLLSKGFEEIDPPFTTPELDDFLRGKNNRVLQMCSGNDPEVLREIIGLSFERAAKLVCANVAALCLHCGAGKNSKHPFCVFAEGSAFYNSLLFSEKLQKYVKSYIEDRLSRFVIFKRAENLTLTGAALSALLN